MNDFGLEERDIQEEFGKWVAVCFFFVSAFFFYSYYYYYWVFFFLKNYHYHYYLPPHTPGGGGGEKYEKANLWETGCWGWGLGFYGLGKCDEYMGGGEGI